jgi:hypothetical protein
VNLRKPNLLYSVNTLLAHTISVRCFGGLHYVWCTPIFSTRNHSAIQALPPPSSCPSDIYHVLADDVRRGDRHSAKIASNRAGLLAAAKKRHEAGAISNADLRDIEEMTTAADLTHFKPLLYLIPYHAVSHLLKDVPVSERANPLSPEYIIEELPTDLFDVIELERG